MRSQVWMSHVSQCPERLARHRSQSSWSVPEQGLPSRTAFHAGFVPHVLQAVLGLVEHVLRVEVDGRGCRASLRFAARSGFAELVLMPCDPLQQLHVAAQLVECFGVGASQSWQSVHGFSTCWLPQCWHGSVWMIIV